jgi:two-component system NtrC family sensor kinase
LGRDPRLENARQLIVMLAPPGEIPLHLVDGRVLSSAALHDALDRDLPTVRLSRSEAAALGLWERTAMAGLAHAEADHFGRWGLVAVATAARERDRGARALGRLMLSVGLATGLVLAFGGLALRKQRKELELARELAVAEVEQARDEELQRASRVGTMGTFAMGIAHEVSTPLGVIVGRAEQLAGRLRDDERGARAAQAILQQADHIRHIVRRFLDLARGGPPAFGRADPADIVRDAVAAVEHRFAKANVSLESDIPTAMPWIQCDRALLEHAIVNLLLNACEACSSGGHVEVTARSDADRVAFVVTDDGVGISPEHAARVTEPFFTTKPEGSGTGLGLAIATEIAKSHRGELTIAANSPRGTRACIEIPVAMPRGDENDQPQ